MEYVNGKLTRAGAEAVIQSGGAVNLGGKIYTRVEHLPSEAAFAAGDQEREQAALRNINMQIAALTAQRGHLVPATPPTAPPATETPVEDDGDTGTRGRKK